LIDEYTFTPSSETLSDIDNIFVMYNNPTFPTLNEKQQVLPYKRPTCENYVEHSPPRRNRRRIDLDDQDDNIENVEPGYVCNEDILRVKLLDSERGD